MKKDTRFIDKQELGGWDELAAAVIEKACEDYRICVLVGDANGARKIEKFFRSKYFSNISNIDAEWLITNLREKYEKEKKEKKYGRS